MAEKTLGPRQASKRGNESMENESMEKDELKRDEIDRAWAEDRSERRSVSDEESGQAGIVRKAIGGYGADEGDAELRRPPLAENSAEARHPPLRKGPRSR